MESGSPLRFDILAAHQVVFGQIGERSGQDLDGADGKMVV